MDEETLVPLSDATRIAVDYGTHAERKQKRYWQAGLNLEVAIALSIGCSGTQLGPILKDRATATSTERAAPTLADQATPTPTERAVPTPVDQATPTPVEQAVPTPVDQVTPTPMEQATPTPMNQAAPALADQGNGETEYALSLEALYPGALDVSTQLALGTILLEETGNAVTPEQAAILLPLWQSLQGGVMAPAEVNAVLKQIEETMGQEQLATIAGMQLTQGDLRAWMQEQGMGEGFAGPGGGPGLPPDELATRRAESGDMSEEERANLRATIEAGGGMPGGGQPGNLSEEERANLRATMEAGGGALGGARGGGGAGGGPLGFLLNPLIERLTQRAAE
jgi:hypothetical protein